MPFAIVGITGSLSESQKELRRRYPMHRIRCVKAVELLDEPITRHRSDHIQIRRCQNPKSN